MYLKNILNLQNSTVLTVSYLTTMNVVKTEVGWDHDNFQHVMITTNVTWKPSNSGPALWFAQHAFQLWWDIGDVRWIVAAWCSHWRSQLHQGQVFKMIWL